jgi:tetratricopeptide (TPR) repeat protein
VTVAEAETWWAEVLGHPRVEPFHANEFAGDIDAIIARAIVAWRARGWTPFIVEHATQQQIVDNATTYVHVFAEGVTKFARRRALASGTSVSLELLVANRSLPVSPGSDVKERMSRDLYEQRLRERIAVEEVRTPTRSREPTWRYVMNFASAMHDSRLMMADLACFAWNRDRRMPAGVLHAWQAFLEGHAFVALRSSDDERIRHLVERGAHGVALQELLAVMSSFETQPAWLVRLRDFVVPEVSTLDFQSFDAALAPVISRIRYEVEVRRDFDVSRRLLSAWRKHLVPALSASLPDAERGRLDWLLGETLALELSAANHRGHVARAEQVLRELEPFRGRLAGRFERLPLALHIRVIEAVHRANIYDHEGAYREMEALSGTLDSLLSILAELAPDAELGSLRSDLLGRALGTALQAAMMAGRRNRMMFDVARTLSDRALGEFEATADRRRQHGYRAQLETDSGALELARGHLAESLGLQPGAQWMEMCRVAREQPFGVMHLARLWAALAAAGSTSEASDLREAFLTNDLARLPAWDSGMHPAPVVFWKAGAALAALGDLVAARPYLDRSIRLSEGDAEALTVRTIGLAAQLERMAVLLHLGEGNALRTATEQLSVTLKAVTAPTAPDSMRTYFGGWRAAVTRAVDERDAAALRKLECDVPY